jgi:hypothetical protein
MGLWAQAPTVVGVNSDEHRRIIGEGLAAHAVTFAELGADEADVHGTQIRELHRTGVTALSAALRGATAAMSAHPQPVRERAGPIRELSGCRTRPSRSQRRLECASGLSGSPTAAAACGHRWTGAARAV